METHQKVAFEQFSQIELTNCKWISYSGKRKVGRKGCQGAKSLEVVVQT